jgi:hypothetical protein
LSVDVYAFGLILYEVVVGDQVLSTPERITSKFFTYLMLGKGLRPELPSSVSYEVQELIGR